MPTQGTTGHLVNYKIRKATLQDRDALQSLIARSARQLGAQDYTVAQQILTVAGYPPAWCN